MKIELNSTIRGNGVKPIAVEVTWTTPHQYLVEETLPSAATATGQLRTPLVSVGLWYLGVVAFLWINLKLPPFLQEENERRTQTN